MDFNRWVVHVYDAANATGNAFRHLVYFRFIDSFRIEVRGIRWENRNDDATWQERLRLIRLVGGLRCVGNELRLLSGDREGEREKKRQGEEEWFH